MLVNSNIFQRLGKSPKNKIKKNCLFEIEFINKLRLVVRKIIALENPHTINK